MPEFHPKPHSAGTASGIKIALRKTSAGSVYVSLTINAEAQAALFGGPVAKGTGFVVTLNSDANKRHILGLFRQDGAAITARSSMRGAIALNMSAWRGCTDQSQKATPCPVIRNEKGVVMLRLPKWAQPEIDSRG